LRIANTTLAISDWKTRISILTLAHVVGTLHIVSVTAMAPVIQTDLDLSVTQVGLLVTGYYAAQTAGAVPAGAFSDRVGVGYALGVSQLLLIAGTLIFNQASSFTLAVTGTVVMGFGYSIVNPATAKGVLEWFPIQRRATAMGVKQTGVPIGGVLAAGNGALVAVVTWNAILYGIVAITVVNALLCLMLAERPPTGGRVEQSPGFSPLRHVWRQRNIKLIFAASIPWNMGQANFFTYLTLFMRETAQASQPMAGLCLGVAQASSALGRVGWGVISDTLLRGGRKTITVSICAAGSVFLAGLALVGPAYGVLLGIALALLLGLTVASYASIAQTLAVESVPSHQSGSAMGYSLTGTSLGGVIGPALFGTVVDLTGDFGDGWLITGALMGAGTILVAFWFKEGRAEGSPKDAPG
jgi:ACS family hexuronate transporter-like MFS transporter